MTEKKSIRITFSDFYRGFDYRDFFIYQILTELYEVIVTDENPDFLFYSCFGSQFLKYDEKITRIFWTGENVLPNFNQCDYSISFLRNDFENRNMFYPLAFSFAGDANISKVDSLLNRKFCSFIASQDTIGEGAVYRKELCLKLMDIYRHVDCAGKVLHNHDAPELAKRGNEKEWHSSKIQFLSKYKFNIAFENTNSDGYLTEKIIDPFLANSVPIYWGSRGNITPFSKNALICADDFASDEELIKYIKYVDSHDEVYMELLNNNPLRDKNFITSQKNKFILFLRRIIEEKPTFLRDPVKKDGLYQVKEFALMSKSERRTLYQIYVLLKGIKSIFKIFSLKK